MTKTLLVSTLLALVSALPAQAAPQPIFQIETNDAKAMQPKRTTTLFDDGTWTADEIPADGSAATHRSGAIAADKMKRVRGELEAAKWTHLSVGIRCHALTSGYTSYRANGAEVFRVQGCGSYKLDEASAKALWDAQNVLDAAAWPSLLMR